MWCQQRRHELDGLRVLAFGLLILYHVGMAYVADWGWHIKSEHLSEPLQYLMLWSNQWRMSLLFLISGAAISYQLARASGVGFMGANARKLLVPLVFGSLVIVAPQAFVESRQAGELADMSYWRFWQNYLGYPFGFGEPLPPVYLRLEPTHIIYNHLWYLLYLFAYVAVLWLMYPLLNSSAARALGRWLDRHLPAGALVVLPIVVLFAIGQWLWADYPTTYFLVDDWYNNARYFFVFALGFALVRSNRLWSALGRMRRFTLLVATASYLGILFYYRGGQLSLIAPFEELLRALVWSANAWLWIAAIIGYGQRYLATAKPRIQAANRAVYCCYIVHQTLIVVALYVLADWHLGPVLEPVTLIALTALGCYLSYRLIRPIPYLRVCFGLFEKAPQTTHWRMVSRSFSTRRKSS
ncbi:acyltransferase family protein [Gilvimarinus algae]|uniref:Acyltransferase n=1 Tax=Gilvimarinus algae TaxID=3058037 RepID=A0ABT8TEW7_9GAMM|nr:acyltransferase [Gilvimarinus sp. SDUM040014]MDO3381628.1 acyltransferase [Gilvimarinus sp. SDUM040014]